MWLNVDKWHDKRCKLHKKCWHVKKYTEDEIPPKKKDYIVKYNDPQRKGKLDQILAGDIFKGDRTGAWIEFDTEIEAKDFYDLLKKVAPDLLPWDPEFCSHSSKKS